MIASYEELGREKEARAELEKYMEQDSEICVESLTKETKRFPFKDYTFLDRQMELLRKAGLPEEPPLPLPDKPSIAVLPFDNLSDDPKQEYFSDGMTDTLIMDLSKISGLFVIARNSVFTYKGKTVKVDQIGRELGVRYILEGSVQRAGNQVRINAQLIDTTKGAGEHLWADRYDGEMDNIFALQDEIIGKIVSALEVKLTDNEQKQMAWKETDNVEAYDAFLKGQGYAVRYTSDDVRKAISYLRKAIELDPNYGQAYALLGDVYLDANHRWTGLPYPDTHMMARKYLDLSMKNPGPYAFRLAGEINIRLRLYREALSELKRGLALTPNDPAMHEEMAWALNCAGRPKEAVEYAKLAMRYDPRRGHIALYILGFANFSMGELEKAGAYFRKSLIHNPENTMCFLSLAATYANLGRNREAQEAVDEAYSHWGFKPTIQFMMYWFPWKDPEIAEKWAEGLRKAGMVGSEYYRILEENRLSGDQIRELVLGQKFSTSCKYCPPLVGHRTEDGTILDRIHEEPVGKSRIDGDLLCDKWDSYFDGLEYCGTVFRNPDGTSDTGDEYLYVTDFQACELLLLPDE